MVPAVVLVHVLNQEQSSHKSEGSLSHRSQALQKWVFESRLSVFIVLIHSSLFPVASHLCPDEYKHT